MSEFDPSTAWLNNIRTIHSSHASSERIRRVREESDRKKHITLSIHNAERLRRMNLISAHSNAAVMRSISTDPNLRSSKEVVELSSRNNSRNSYIRQNLLRPSPNSTENSAEEDRMLNAMAADLAITEQSNHPISDDIIALLEQFKQEPSSEEDLSTKFTIYENFAGTICAIREHAVEFFSSNIDKFEGLAKSSVMKKLREIDSPEALSVPNGSSNWIVYEMAKKANENGALINNLLEDFKSKLALLASAVDECPFCLSSIANGTSRSR